MDTALLWVTSFASGPIPGLHRASKRKGRTVAHGLSDSGARRREESQSRCSGTGRVLFVGDTGGGNRMTTNLDSLTLVWGTASLVREFGTLKQT